MKSLTLLTTRRRSTHLSNSFEVLDDLDNDGYIYSDKISTHVIDLYILKRYLLIAERYPSNILKILIVLVQFHLYKKLNTIKNF